MKKVVVIGAGFAGLSAAANLAYKGYKVQLIEKNNHTGGRAMVFKSNGFKFDMGPSWYMIPDVFDKFFTKVGRNREDYFRIKKLEPSYKVFFEDGKEVKISTDPNNLKNIFESIEPGSFRNLQKYLTIAKSRYNIAFDKFIYRNFSTLFSMLNFNLIKNAFKLGVFKSWQGEVESYFKSKKLQQILTWHSVFVGGEPRNIIYVLANDLCRFSDWYLLSG